MAIISVDSTHVIKKTKDKMVNCHLKLPAAFWGPNESVNITTRAPLAKHSQVKVYLNKVSNSLNLIALYQCVILCINPGSI